MMTDDRRMGEISRTLEHDDECARTLRREKNACEQAQNSLRSVRIMHHDIWMGLSDGLKGGPAYAAFTMFEDQFDAGAGTLASQAEQEADERGGQARRLKVRDEDLLDERRRLNSRREDERQNGREGASWA